MALHHVIMGDVTASSGRSGDEVASLLASAVGRVGAKFSQAILSPLTITLGDEFQGVVRDHQTLVEIVLEFETVTLRGDIPFALHYSMATGEIDTPINSEIAHGMLGAALTEARARLTDKSKDRPNVAVTHPNPNIAGAMEAGFDILTRRVAKWRGKDGRYIADLVSDLTVDEIMERHGRDDSVIYRRRNSDPVRDFVAARDMVRKLARIADREGNE